MNALIFALTATALSISSTNEYYFTRPISTNLVGKTYLLTGGAIPRYEDIAFLNEAYFERQRSVTAHPLAKASTVPTSFVLSGGRFANDVLAKLWLAPSFGYWDGFSAYHFGYFVKPGITVDAPDFRSCDSRFLWDGEPTAATNAIRAFVSDSDFCLPTNIMPAVSLSGPLRTIKSAYGFLTNGVCVFENAAYKNPEYRKIGDLYTWRSLYYYNNLASRTRTSYTYPKYDGTTGSGDYTSAITLTGQTLGEDKVYTNRPEVVSSLTFATKSRTASRYIGLKITYKGQTTNAYDRFQVGSQWESETDVSTFNSSSGNLLVFSDALDAPPTNCISSAKCILVCQLMFRRMDYYTGTNFSMRTVPGRIDITNYVATVNVGDMTYVGDYVSGGETNGVYDSGINLFQVVSDLVNGFSYVDWVNAVSLPDLDYPPEDMPFTSERTISTRHIRQLYVYPVHVWPHIYVDRTWNARLPQYD